MHRFMALALALWAAVPAVAQDMPLSQILLPGQGWHTVPAALRSVRSLAADGKGNVYVADPTGNQVVRVGLDDRASVLVKTSAGIHGLCSSPDGRLHGTQPENGRLVILEDGKETTWVEGLAAHDLVLTRAGDAYCTVPGEKAVYLIERSGKKRRVANKIESPAGLVLWSDDGTLVVGDAAGKRLLAFRIEKDGSLTDREGYYLLCVRPGQASGVAGLTIDSAGRVFAASREGIQVFDPTGRLSGILLRPQRAPITAVAFGGGEQDRLYVGCCDRLYVRATQAKAATSEKR
jgi:sugar lactone lactonase YvrE